MAGGSLALELLAPAALLDRRLGRAWSVAAFGMHWGIKAVMGITFRHQMSGVMYLPQLLRGRQPGKAGCGASSSSSSAGRRGRTTTKAEPTSGVDRTVTRPP